MAGEITIAGKSDHETLQAEFDIAGGVNVGKDDLDVCAVHQGICFHLDFEDAQGDDGSEFIVSAPSQGLVVLIAMLKADDQINIHTQIATYFKDEYEAFDKACVECVYMANETIIVGVCVGCIACGALCAQGCQHFPVRPPESTHHPAAGSTLTAQPTVTSPLVPSSSFQCSLWWRGECGRRLPAEFRRGVTPPTSGRLSQFSSP